MQKRILIVDDSEPLRCSARRLLERAGWIVVGEAIDGKDGIEKAQILHPDIVVLDLSMPVMNGVEAARELRRLWPSMLLLLFTSYKSTEINELAVSVGIDAVVDKAEPLTLVDCIRTLLDTAA